jgi:hypothetical protein
VHGFKLTTPTYASKARGSCPSRLALWKKRVSPFHHDPRAVRRAWVFSIRDDNGPDWLV